MKYFILIPLVLLTACASKKPTIVHMPHTVSGPIVPAEEMESIRYGENLKAYTVGRYAEPNDPLVMHERHLVYRVETTPKWNLHPNPTASVPMGPVNAIIDPARRAPPINAEVISEVNRQKGMTQTLIAQQQRMDQVLKSLSGTLTANQQTAEQNVQLKQELNVATKRLDLLEQQLRSQPNPPATLATNETDHW